MTNITENQLKQLNYIDNAIKNLKPDKQRIAIQKKEQDQSIRKRKLIKVKTEPRKVFINHLMTFKLESDITDAEMEKEQEWAETMNFIL